MTTRDDLLAAAGPSVDPGRWLGTFDELMTRAGARFSRAEPRRRARAFVLGLLARNGETFTKRKTLGLLLGFAGIAVIGWAQS